MKLIFIFMATIIFPVAFSQAHSQTKANPDSIYSKMHWFANAKLGIFRKIILHVKLACPDIMRCADWDYLDFTRSTIIGCTNRQNKDFEIRRMLTRYGGVFSKDHMI